MKTTLFAFATYLLTLTFSASIASAGTLDDRALSALDNAYNSASAAYYDNPTTDGLYAVVFTKYASLFLSYRATYNNNSFRYYGSRASCYKVNNGDW